MRRILNELKIPFFFQWKTVFSQFIIKFLQFQVMEYLIRYFSNVNSLILCKLLILFSAVKLELGHNFPQHIHRFKIRIFECWS